MPEEALRKTPEEAPRGKKKTSERGGGHHKSDNKSAGEIKTEETGRRPGGWITLGWGGVGKGRGRGWGSERQSILNQNPGTRWWTRAGGSGLGNQVHNNNRQSQRL